MLLDSIRWIIVFGGIMYNAISAIQLFTEVSINEIFSSPRYQLLTGLIALLLLVWICIEKSVELKKYLNARANLEVKSIEEQKFGKKGNRFYRYGIEIENRPKAKAKDGSSDTNISIDFIIYDKKIRPFRCTRWNETFTRQEIRQLGQSPLKNTSVNLEADKDKRIAFFLGRFENSKHLLIHNDDSYIGNKFFNNPKQIISKRRFEIKAEIKANRADNLIAWIEVENRKGKHPQITVTKIEKVSR